VPGLYVAGEAVGGANGANRLSGNAITEAFVFGRRAGRSAAERAKAMPAVPDHADNTQAVIDLVTSSAPRDINTAEMVQTLQATMQDDVGALRTEARLKRALATLDSLDRDLGDVPPGDGGRFDMRLIDWLDLRNMLMVSRVVAQAALARTETRGAQHREDYPDTSPDWAVNQFVDYRGGRIVLSRAAAPAQEAVAS
jgi:succinate dehydrogenase flavoprotein subunit